MLQLGEITVDLDESLIRADVNGLLIGSKLNDSGKATIVVQNASAAMKAAEVRDEDTIGPAYHFGALGTGKARNDKTSGPILNQSLWNAVGQSHKVSNVKSLTGPAFDFGGENNAAMAALARKLSQAWKLIKNAIDLAKEVRDKEIARKGLDIAKLARVKKDLRDTVAILSDNEFLRIQPLGLLRGRLKSALTDTTFGIANINTQEAQRNIREGLAEVSAYPAHGGVARTSVINATRSSRNFQPSVSITSQRGRMALKFLAERADLALLSQPVRGGIDLNSANMGMTVTKDANGGVKVNFDPAMIALIRKEGIQSAVPVIVDVHEMPLADIRPLLGFNNSPPQQVTANV